MKTELRRFFQVSNSKIEVFNLDDLDYGINYEVLTETIFDYEGNEYLSLDDVPDSLRASRDYIAHPDLLETNIAISLNRQIDFRKAKKCRFGVIQMLKGKHKGKQFIFPVYDMDFEVQLMAYEILTTGKVLRPFIKILQHPEHVKYIQLVLGVIVFEEISQFLNLDTNVLGG
jgi:hypothetical protein